MISNLFLEFFGDKLMSNSWTDPYGFLWKPNENAHRKLFNVRHMWSIVAVWLCLWTFWGWRAMSYSSSLAEHLEENLEQSSSSISIHCMGDWGQGDKVSESMRERDNAETAGKLTAYLMYYQSESVITWLLIITMHSSSVHLSSSYDWTGPFTVSVSTLAGPWPYYFFASPHLEPEGGLLALHSARSLRRESCSLPERMVLADSVTDRLPWLSYHSADAVHSKGTVLW